MKHASYRMSDKLQKIANEAWAYAVAQIPHVDKDSLIEYARRREVELTKYAELIIKAKLQANEVYLVDQCSDIALKT